MGNEKNLVFKQKRQGGKVNWPQAGKRNQVFNLVDTFNLWLETSNRGAANGQRQRKRSCDADPTRWASKSPSLEPDWISAIFGAQTKWEFVV